MLEIVPAATKSGGADGSDASVAGEDSGPLYFEDVDEVALGD